MTKFLGVVYAALTALVIGLAPMPSANAAPAMTGSGGIVRDTLPELTNDVRWHRGRGYRGGWHGRRVVVVRPYRHGFYRPYRPAYYGGSYGPRCFWRPARSVWTPYGWRWRPAARICRW